MVEEGLMRVANVGNALNIESPILYTRDSTPEKGLICVWNVVIPLSEKMALLYTRECTQ
jgi:hypothetical protein